MKNFFQKSGIRHGIHPPQCKDATAGRAVRRLPFPSRLVIPLSQHIGAPAVPIVTENQEVVRGEPIAKAKGFVSVPMHAPVTGIVERIGLAVNAMGQQTPAIVLRPYPAASQEILYGAPRDIGEMSTEEIVQAVQDTGIVGLGGAGFPTHVKLAVPEGKRVDTILVNGCECEPYLTTDHRVMLEQIDQIVDGIRIVLRTLNAERVIIGIEDNKMDAIEALRNGIPADLPIEVSPLETKYPQGAEKMVITALLGKEVPSGGLPIDVGAAVFNVGTLAQMGDLLPRRQGLIERVVTVAGSGITKPGNYLMPLGASLGFVLEHAGASADTREVILGGPMMGFAVSCFDAPITKGVTGILALAANGKPRTKVYPCIKCGECLAACPLDLNPSQLGILAKGLQYETMEERYHLNDCFECGCCAYVCPSNIPLVQYYRIAKQMNRERKAAECP